MADLSRPIQLVKATHVVARWMVGSPSFRAPGALAEKQSCWRFSRTHGGASHTLGMVARRSNTTLALLQPTPEGSGHRALNPANAFLEHHTILLARGMHASGDQVVTAKLGAGLHRSQPRIAPIRKLRDGNGVDRARSLAPHACHRRTSQPECWTCRQGNAGPTHRCSNVQHPAIDNGTPALRPPPIKPQGSS